MAAFIPNRYAMPEDIITNGTVSFIQTPERKILLTNAHVWNGFLDEKANTPNAEFVLLGKGEAIGITDATLIAIDEGRDIAVLTCDRPEEVAKIGKSFYAPKVWPPAPPAEGEDMVFVGFPGMHRSEEGNTITVVHSLFAPRVIGIGDRLIRLEFTNSDKVVEQFKEGLKPFGPLGGVSGSALYRFLSGTTKFDLSGVVFGAGDNLACIMAARLDCLNGDGSLNS